MAFVDEDVNVSIFSYRESLLSSPSFDEQDISFHKKKCSPILESTDGILYNSYETNINPPQEANNNIETNPASAKIIILNNQILQKSKNIVSTAFEDFSKNEQNDCDLADPYNWNFENSGSGYIPSDTESNSSDMLEMQSDCNKRKYQKT
ncbi:hypothetical protein ABEB36_014474 [Hypothenemus hampei]|uniref:Uncharacterized protein n=1 Tax=Hypothenemus hampei TaxID=57062 RepID=A0ABD1E4N2_HYPHA